MAAQRTTRTAKRARRPAAERPGGNKGRSAKARSPKQPAPATKHAAKTTKGPARKRATAATKKRAVKTRRAAKPTTKPAAGSAESYARKKIHKGKAYSGMRVGGVHRWTYPDGVWHERKVGRGDWQIDFASHKHRKGKAPKGSGAEVGSGYHWLIIADQWVRKVDANQYATIMAGEKHLVSFQKPDWGRWNTQFRNQKPARQKTIKILREVLARLEAEEEAESVENPEDHPSHKGLGIVKAAPDVIREMKKQQVRKQSPLTA